MNMPARAKPVSRPSEQPRGMALLRDPLLNKGTAFTEAERDALGLRGLLPPHVLTMDEQVERVLDNLRTLPTDLEKYVALNALHDRNEALFFRVVMRQHRRDPADHLHADGRASPARSSASIFQRPRGMFITANDRGRIAELLRNWPHPRQADRRHRRRAHPRPRRSRRQRHGHPGRQALALHGLRRHPSRSSACR